MTEATDRIGQLSPLKRALLALEELQAKVDALEHGQREAIAIIGLGCRYPGVKSPQEFWKLLENGVDAIQEVPKERWDWEAYYDPDPEAAGKMYTRWGGFIDGIDQFDPAFFSISPREAANMDPQQRLLLEVAWEALEHAGQRAGELAGSATGVFVGISSNDFASLFKSGGTIEQVNPYIGTGTAFSVAAGRLSYSLGLQGPCISIDTACSSSLVAVHLAAQSLRSGECRLAIAAGVNAILSPEGTIYFSRLRAMAHDGRCKTFDATADGYVRSEGCGVVVLKRLSDALADGDRVLAVILGSAINQDGRSNGLTAPNPLAQQAVVQSALNAAGISPHQVSFVETHGTGTELGDPIEVRALGAVFGDRRTQGDEPAVPVYLGAVKANIGHSEAAAGVAGLIKVVLSVQHAQIPAQLHVKELNPLVDWDQYPFVIPNQTTPWPAINGKRIAGLSSFGFSGTNAHIVLADPASVSPISSIEPADKAQAVELLSEPPAVLLPISARTPQALQRLAATYQKFLTEPVDGQDLPGLADVVYTASYRTSHHPNRLAVVADSNRAAADLLGAWLQGEKRPYLVAGEANQASLVESPNIVFVFPGQGSQWVGMGRELLQQEPVFRRSIEHCDQAIQKYAGWSLIEKLTSDQAAESLISEIDVIQPALFAMQVSLAELWMSWGIRPRAVVGHSLGEVAAAAIAGALSLEEAAHIICLRSQLMRRVSGQGAMAVIGINLEEAENLVKPVEHLVSVGVSNGPRSTVISGDPAAIDQIVGDLDRQGIFARRVKVDVASHSVQMEPLRAELVSGLSGLQPHAGLIPVYSTVLNRLVDGSELTEEYWGNNLRNPVRFWSVVQQLVQQGQDVFIEISPHPVLVTAIRDGLKEIGRPGLALPSARKQESERAVMLETVGALYAAGSSIPGLLPDPQHNPQRQVELPTYPWDHQRFWIQDGRVESASIRYAAPNGHPLLGMRLSSASQPGVQFWETELTVNQAPYLKDHRVLGAVMLPAASYLDAALTAARQALGQGDDGDAAGTFEIEQAIFHQALVLSDEGAKELQLVISETAGDLASGQAGFRFQLFSRQDYEHPGFRERWNLHASGLCRPGGRSTENNLTLEGLRQRFVEAGSDQLPIEPYYEALRQAGLEYGPYFQGIQEIWARPAEALAHIQPLAEHQPLLLNKQYSIHPALLDAAFQALGAAVTSRYQAEQQALDQLPGEMQALASQKPLPTWVPVAIERFRLMRRPESTELWSHAVLLDPSATVGNPSLSASPTNLKGDITLWDAGGQVIAEVFGLQLQQLAPSVIRKPIQDQPAAIERWFYRTTWQPAATLREPAANGVARPIIRKRWLILGDSDENTWQKSLGTGLAEKLAVAQAQCVYAACPDDIADLLRLLQRTGGLDGLDGIVSLVGLRENQSESLNLAELEEYQAATLGRLLHLVQSVSQLDLKTTPRLYLVTRNAQRTGIGSASDISTALGAASSSIWGLGRTIIHEQSDLNCCLVDLSLASGADSQAELSLLADELLFNPGGSAAENQIALRGDDRYVARLERYDPGESETASQLETSLVLFDPVKDQNFRLTTRSQPIRTGDSSSAPQSSTAGDLDSLALQIAPRVSPGPGQIEILVQAAGLNFLDVLTALGLRPDLPPGPIQFGTECAGRVVAIGEGVDAWQVGDEVIAIAPASFGLYTTTLSSLAARKPAALTWEQAAAIPIVFLTASYALEYLARLQPGERVLIHAGAGGVGLAAIQLARLAGAAIFATAGSPEKRELLASLGVQYVMDSRSLAFADQVLQITADQPGEPGVDIILNSLAGEAVEKGLAVLRSYGRFLEIGKRDIYANNPIGLWPFRKNIAYFAIDLARMAVEKPNLLGEMLVRLVERFERGELQALPVQAFSMSNAPAAFRFMAQSRHTGKIVLTRPEETAMVKPAPTFSGQFRSDRTYLITGGLGGLGLAFAEWMGQRGAGVIALLGRSAPSPAALETIDALRLAGIQVDIFQADVASEQSIGAVLAELRANRPPLGGIFHAAGVLDDGILAQLNLERFQKVFAPKVRGSWILHQQTLSDPLDFFVLFSSASSLIGSPGQGNYAAANAYMDGLAEYRRSRGLPALSIQWAPWTEVGLAARPERGGRLAQRGFDGITPEQGLAAFEILAAGLQAVIGVMPIRMDQWREFYPSALQWPYLSQLIQEMESGSGGVEAVERSAVSRTSGILAEILAIKPGDDSTVALHDLRRDHLMAYIQSQLAQVLGMSAGQIDAHTSLAYLGLDSLMAVELKNRLETNLKLVLPVTALLRGPNPRELAELLLAQIVEPDDQKYSGVAVETPEKNGIDLLKVSATLEEVDREPFRDYPLSHGQRALWLQHQMAPGSVYNPVYAVRIRSSVEPAAMQAACWKLIERHPALRTVFLAQSGEPVQRVYRFNASSDPGKALDPAATNPEIFSLVDASGWPENTLNDRLLKEAYTIYALESGPLVRMLLFTISPEEHILVLTAHHIVVDLWSLTLIANEFGILYKAISSGYPDGQLANLLPAPQVKYSDYVRWQQKLLESPQGEQMWEYWRQQLSGELPVLELPADRPHPPVQTYDGSIQTKSLGKELTRKIRSLGERFGVTPFVILLAAFQTLLYRYTGQEDIIVGSPTTGRTRPEFSNVIGYFASPVALRTRFNGNPKFSEILSTVQQSVLDALSYQDYPFVQLVEKLHPTRDPSRPPIFQVMFVLQRSHLLYQEGLTQLALSREGVEMDLGGLPLSSVVLEERMSPFDLTMQIADSESELAAAIEYNTGLFDSSTIQRMLSHYLTLLEQVVFDPDQSIRLLPMLSQQEKNQLLVGLNQTRRSWSDKGISDRTERLLSEQLCIHHLFERQVEQTPEAVALVFEEKSLTFAELNRRANRLAHSLIALGVGPEVIVGIILERSIDMIVAMLGVLKAGGAYLPMDPNNPADRLAFMMQDARVPVVLTHSHLLDRLPTLTAQLVYLDKNWEGMIDELLVMTQRPAIDRQGIDLDKNPASPVNSRNLAYIIYTSGSTGRSKGVMIQHAGVCNLALAQVEAFVLDSSSRTLQFASFSFDASVSEILTSLLSGGTLYLARLETLMSIPDLLQTLQKHAITAVTLPPSVLAMLPSEQLPNLKTLVSAGENCTPEIVSKWAVGRYFLNAYGPTEATVGPTFYRIDGRESTSETILEQLKGRSGVPIGRPISNMEIYLLDSNRQPVPIGIPGEIYVSGIGVARGYLNRPEMTAEKFITNPYWTPTPGNPYDQAFPHDRLYRTGDLARYDLDGNLEFMGRVDFQVKIRGFRIEMEEIESVISQHPQVQMAAVVARGNKHEEKRLVAYLSPEPGASLSVNDLRSYLRQYLPEYMIPGAFVLLDALPLNNNGKVDRKALPDVDNSRPELDAAYVPPQTEMERIVAGIWQEVLNIERVGLNDNFFDLGGHSLLMFKAHTRLQETLNRTFSMVDLFRYPTVISLADYLSKDSPEQANLQKTQDRAELQKEAMKRQVDRMREIANTRASAAREAALKRIGPQGNVSPGEKRQAENPARQSPSSGVAPKKTENRKPGDNE